jgi:SAM-dependent methyltransferase
MATKVRFTFESNCWTPNGRAEPLLAGCVHYGRSDRPMFTAGYNELCRLDLNGGKVVEICCGVGELAMALARVFPKAEVIACDRYPDAGRAIREAAQHGGPANLRYRCGDALNLHELPNGSVDMVYGQATLHHLAHDTTAVSEEFSRVLKPGGRLVFIYEPLGHNPFWAMIRAYRIARAKIADESNITIAQLEEVASAFSTCEVQPFNLAAYPMKFLGRIAGSSIINRVHRWDRALMRRSPRMTPWAANFNVVFTK